MPSIDPKTGKPVGGAAKTRKKKAELEAERKRKPAKPAKPAKAAEFLHIDPQPDSTADFASWSARGLAALAYRAAQDRTIFATELDQLRFLSDTFAKLAKANDKGAEQERMKKLADSMGQGAGSGAVPRGAKGLAGIQKPTTARRA